MATKKKLKTKNEVLAESIASMIVAHAEDLMNDEFCGDSRGVDAYLLTSLIKHQLFGEGELASGEFFKMVESVIENNHDEDVPEEDA